jgi:hypothetical protein
VTPLTSWQAVIGVAGLVVFGYGLRTDSNTIRWAGIAVLAISVALRFVKKRRTRKG